MINGSRIYVKETDSYYRLLGGDPNTKSKYQIFKRYLVIILIILAGFFNAIMDTQRSFYNNSYLKIQDPSTKIQKVWDKWSNTESWKNKHKNRDYTQGELFPGSRTVFVFVTDLWHFAQGAMILMFCLAIIHYRRITRYRILDAFLLFTCFGLSFEILFRLLIITPY